MQYEKNQLHEPLAKRPHSYEIVKLSYIPHTQKMGISFTDEAGSGFNTDYIINVDSQEADELLASVQEHCVKNRLELNFSARNMRFDDFSNAMLDQLKKQASASLESIFSNPDIENSTKYQIVPNNDKMNIRFFEGEKSLRVMQINLGPLSKDSERLTKICQEIEGHASDKGLQNINTGRSIYQILLQNTGQGR